MSAAAIEATPKAPPTFKVFVYGSLKRGFGNHGLLQQDGADFVREAKTRPGFTMYSLGGFPGIIRTGEGVISGEVFSVNERVLRHLDRLEGHPSFYRREDIILEDGEEVMGYVLPVGSSYMERCPVVEGGVWTVSRGR